MNWPELLETLKDRGWTQALLSERIQLAQSAISDLWRGAVKEPKYSKGEALRALLESGERPVSDEKAAA